MKIIVISDTHGNIETSKHFIRRANPDMVIHLGDTVYDAELLTDIFPNLRFEYVPGNGDYYSHLPLSKTILIHGKTVYLTHGHKQSVKSGISILRETAKTIMASVALYGHTHKAKIEQSNGIWLICPGTAGTGSGTCAELKIDANGIDASVLTME